MMGSPVFCALIPAGFENTRAGSKPSQPEWVDIPNHLLLKFGHHRSEDLELMRQAKLEPSSQDPNPDIDTPVGISLAHPPALFRPTAPCPCPVTPSTCRSGIQ